MNAIAGTLQLNKNRPDRGLTQKMLEAMRFRGTSLPKSVSSGAASFGSYQEVNHLSDPQIILAYAGNLLNSELLDGEQIAEAYLRDGLSFVEKLEGSFAIVLYDQKNERLVIARDRLGLAPLYVAKTPDSVHFASTLPALTGSLNLDTSLNLKALHHYMSWHSIVPGEDTVLNGVKKLPAATLRVYEADGSVRDEKYWDPPYRRDENKKGWGESEWAKAVHEALTLAVQEESKRDKNTGVLLSGGLDSSMIVALMHEAGARNFDTFSIGFESTKSLSGDEFQYSDIIAERFNTNHYRLRVSNAQLLDALPGAIDAMSEPMASHDATAFFLLSRLVSEHTNFVQSGQGADEVFGGYNYHQNPKDFVAVFSDYTHEELANIFNDDFFVGQDFSAELLQQLLHSELSATPLDSVLRADAHALMIDDPVKRVDNMMHSHAVSARVPFLNQHVVELAAQCPPELKLAEGGKGILKQVGRKIMPSAVIDRPKGYFPVPGFRYLEGDILSLVRDTVAGNSLKNRGIFREDYLKKLLENPNETAETMGQNALWSIAVLEMWLQNLKI